MKRYLGILVLLILFAALSGCTTQPAKPVATTAAVTTTAAVPAVPTVEKTPLPVTTEKKGTTVVPTVKETKEVTTAAATTRPEMTPSTKVTIIHIQNNTFVPDQLTVLPGTGITWINDDVATHVVKSTGDATGKFTSSEMVNGARFTYTFGEKTGTYEFTDPGYPEMKGAIIVKKGEALVGD